jgi:hypothetical protein
MISKLKDWNAARKHRRAMKLFTRLMQDSTSKMQEIFNTECFKVSAKMFMQMMDREGFVHCAVCPSRGPLKNIAKTKLCTTHYDQAMEARHNLQHPTQKEEDSNARRNEGNTSQTEAADRQPDPSAV